MSILEDFKSAGMQASFHYADDSGKEWGRARTLQNEAMQMYRDNPDLQDEMKTIAKGFLWSLPKETRKSREGMQV